MRRIPSHTTTTRAPVVGSGRSRSWWANRIADSRRLIVPTLAPARASSVRYPLIVAAPAGSGSSRWRVHQAVNSHQSLR